MQTSEMQSLIDWDAILPMNRYAGGHDEQMRALFKGATVIAHWNDGGYHGTVATAVMLADGRYCWYQDSYGSCDVCDVWSGASDESVRKLCIDLANSARVFSCLELLRADMVYVLNRPEKGSWYTNAAAALLAILPDPITPISQI